MEENYDHMNANDNVLQPLIPKDIGQISSYSNDFYSHGSIINDENLIHINFPDRHSPKASNKISTSKYTWYNFFPKIVFEQFSKMANVYFLIIAIMQSINEISISGGKPAILLPLTIVIFINGLKDFLEDRKRKESDDQENSQICKIYNKNIMRFFRGAWEDVRLGDFVQVEENESFPADMILVNSSDSSGMCYVETKNLDGETSLKYRHANQQLREICNEERSLSLIKHVVQITPADDLIYEFDAKVFKNVSNRHDYIHVDKNSFLLRGCTLKQTKFVWGVVVYVGHNTKIQKNSPNVKSKTSRVERSMNYQIVVIFIVDLFLSVIGAFCNVLTSDNQWSNFYLNIGNQLPAQQESIYMRFVSRLGTWILIFTNLVPISLLVTMEMVKFIQGMFISWDADLMNFDRKIRARVQTSTLNEELGQVSYIFSDKTGTLTTNYMEFRKMTIGGDIYGETENCVKMNTEKLEDKLGSITNVNFTDEYRKFEKHKRNPSHENYLTIDLFLKCLTICNTVIIDENEWSRSHKLVYQATSPDELALVNASRKLEYIFKGRDNKGTIYTDINQKEERFHILNVLEYTSERKRMSIIVRCQDGAIRLFIKGADTVIRDRITKNAQIIPKTEQFLLSFAKEGLRTLMIAYREIKENEYETWNQKFKKALESPKDSSLQELTDQMESNLCLLGATAIEDQLQKDLDKTIKAFREAGIKLWILTGDKQDTAKSVAFSCKLLTHDFYLIEIPEKSSNLIIENILKEGYRHIQTYNAEKIGLIISTDELSKILKDQQLATLFFQAAIRCQAVVCSRLTPKQKAEMINLVKTKQENATIMAVGDGANDVNMITNAHIGIGILGVEGTQAARASDYAIAEFSHLQKLLFVHGRESYRKNSFIVCYNFYKNVLFVMPQFWFGMVSYFSGQTLYDPWIYQLFNTIFSSLPIIWFGIYDIEIESEELMENPKYYVQGIVGKLFHSVRFWKWVFLGIAQGYFIFLFSYYSICSGSPSGEAQDLWSLGSMAYSSIVLVVNLKILFVTSTHSVISILLLSLTVLSYYITLILMSLYYRFENFNNFTMLFGDLRFYLASLLLVVFLCVLDIGISKILIYYGIVKDGKKLEPKIVDEHLIKGAGMLQEEAMKNKYCGEAFSQQSQVQNILKFHSGRF